MPSNTNMEESHYRSRSRASSGRSEAHRSPTRSSSRPDRTAGSSPHRFETGDRSLSQARGWRASAVDTESRVADYERPRRLSIEGDRYDRDRRGAHTDHNPSRRRGLEYDPPAEKSLDTWGHRDHRSNYNSYRYDQHDHRSEYSQPRRYDRNPSYNDTYLTEKGPEGHGVHRHSQAQDRWHSSSQEQLNSRRREPPYNNRYQPQAQTSTWPQGNQDTGWPDANTNSGSRTLHEDGQGRDRYQEKDSSQSWKGVGQGRSDSQRPVEPNPWPPTDEGQASRYAPQGSQGLTPGNGLGSHKNENPRSRSQGSQHRSPRLDRYVPSPSPPREESKQLKRSGSPTLSPNDRSQNGSRSKKARVEPQPPLPPITTDIVMQSVDSEKIPPPPRDTPPEPPADEDIPAAPPSSAPDVQVGHTEADQVNMNLVSGISSSALQPENQPENPANVQILQIPSTGQGLPVVTALPEPTAAETLSVASSSVEMRPPISKTSVKVEVIPEKITSPLKPSSPMVQHVRSPTPPAWSPNVPGSGSSGAVWKGNSPLPGQLSPKGPNITMQDMSSPPRAPTPNPNLNFSFLDYHTPAHSGNNTPLINRAIFVRQKGQRLDPKDDAAAYERRLIGVTKLDDFNMPTGNDKKEATLGKGTFG